MFVSHNMAAVENLCSRGIWIANGEIRLDAPTHEVIEAYMASFASADSASNEITGVDGRRGSGEIRFTRVEFLSTAGDLQTVTRCGKSLVIRLHYRANEPIERPNFGLRMYSDMGTLVTDTSTWLHGLDIPLVPAGDGHLDLAVAISGVQGQQDSVCRYHDRRPWLVGQIANPPSRSRGGRGPTGRRNMPPGTECRRRYRPKSDRASKDLRTRCPREHARCGSACRKRRASPGRRTCTTEFPARHWS